MDTTYTSIVEHILTTGSYKPSRTGVDTVSSFSEHYTIDLTEGFPLLTTKQLDGYRWNSLLHEIEWYLSGEEHIRSLQDETSIWDAWATDTGTLETAYGRFWRRFPVPQEKSHLPGENWVDETTPWVYKDNHTDTLVCDQLKYVVDVLAGRVPDVTPESRRLVVSAWHPSNATTSKLPPCHFSFVLTTQNGQLNTHLTQRSGDIALGIPFNVAAYSILTHLIANETPFEPGHFSHTIVDAHAYAGTDTHGTWYKDHLPQLQTRITNEPQENYPAIANWIESQTPPKNTSKPLDHIPNLLRQLSREPNQRPQLSLNNMTIDTFNADTVSLTDYTPHEPLSFGVAE